MSMNRQRNLFVYGTFYVFLIMILAAAMTACGSDEAVPEVPKTYSISGVIATDDGGAAAGASVALLHAAGDSIVQQAKAGSSGEYMMTGVEAGSYEITAALDGYETGRITGVEVNDADLTDRDIVLQKIVAPTYSVSGTVTLSDGGAAAGASVQIKKAGDNTNVGQAATTDASGAYTISGVPAGEYKIVISLDGYQTEAIDGVAVSNADLTVRSVALKPVEINSNAVVIQFAGDNASVANPYASDGVTVTASGANVSVVSTSARQIELAVSGTTGDGSLIIQSATDILLTLQNASITAPSSPAIRITSDITATIQVNASNRLSDGNANTQNATLTSKGAFVFDGYGSLEVSGAAKHAVTSSKEITVREGNITIAAAASDGFHSEGFAINGGSLNIAATGDGIDAGGGTIVINGGDIKISSEADDTKGIKADETIAINGGAIALTISGAQSKGIGGKKDIVINGGNISIVTSGKAVLEEDGSGYDPSYCTAIKSDANVTVAGGTIWIDSRSTADGGKGISADGDIIISDGSLNITTAGDGKIYTTSTGATDSYTAACIKSDKNILLAGGNITCSSSGKGGKGIAADGTITIGIAGADNAGLTLTAGTSGERFLVSGGGRPGESSADYANPKAVKCEGDMFIHSGNISITCTQTTDGGEGLESKSTLTINGGNIDIHTYDDCINAENNITINGGYIYCTASGNDAIDSNGTLTITGGFTIANGARGAEDGFDADNHTFTINGGTVIGTGGASSNPTESQCKQPSIKCSVTAGSAIGVTNAAGETLLLYQTPATAGGSSGAPGQGGGSSLTVLFSDPRLLRDGTYTLHYGGSISGGTTVNGYNSGGTYLGGSTKSFTISSMLTTVR
ncbi:MAG: carbohydrate-binding domain-containing protein [Bacteroidales bacterium]